MLHCIPLFQICLQAPGRVIPEVSPLHLLQTLPAHRRLGHACLSQLPLVLLVRWGLRLPLGRSLGHRVMCCTEQASTTVWHVSRHKRYCITSIADLSFVPHLWACSTSLGCSTNCGCSTVCGCSTNCGCSTSWATSVFFFKARTSIADLSFVPHLWACSTSLGLFHI